MNYIINNEQAYWRSYENVIQNMVFGACAITDDGNFRYREWCRYWRSEFNQLQHSIVVCHPINHHAVIHRSVPADPEHWVAFEYVNKLEYQHFVIIQVPLVK